MIFSFEPIYGSGNDKRDSLLPNYERRQRRSAPNLAILPDLKRELGMPELESALDMAQARNDGLLRLESRAGSAPTFSGSDGDRPGKLIQNSADIDLVELMLPQAPSVLEMESPLGAEPKSRRLKLSPQQRIELRESALAEAARRVAESGLSVLTTVATLIDKPRAAISGLLAGQPSQVLTLLPFSESFLRGFWNGAVSLVFGPDEWIPKHHITGREVLEAWGAAPSNRAGWHPISDPEDALFDVLGVAAEFLSFPPVAPVIGGFSSKYLKLIRQGKQVPGLSGRLYRDLASSMYVLHRADALGDVAQELGRTGRITAGTLNKANPFLRELGPITEEGAERVTRSVVEAAGTPKEAARIFEASSKGPDAILNLEHERLINAIGTSLEKSIGESVSTVVEAARAGRDPMLGTGIVSPLGVARQLESGERSLISLAPTWKFLEDIGVPQIDIPVPPKVAGAIGKAIVNNTLAKGFLSFFHWTTGGAVSPAASEMRQRAADLSLQLRQAVDDANYVGNTVLSRLAGAASGLKVKMGHYAPEAQPSFDNLVRAAVELGATFREDRAAVASRLANLWKIESIDRNISPAAMLYELSNITDNVYTGLSNALRSEFQKLGVQVGDLENIFTAGAGGGYIPRVVPEGLREAERPLQEARAPAFRHFPTLTVNQITSDPLLTAPRIGPSDIPAFSVGFKTPADVFLPPGAAVAGKSAIDQKPTMGRLLGIGKYKDKKGVVISYGDLAEDLNWERKFDVVEASTVQLARELPPDVEFGMVRLNANQQEIAMQKWLSAAGIKFAGKGDALRRAYAYHRYIEPFVTDANIPEHVRFLWAALSPSYDHGSAAKVLRKLLKTPEEKLVESVEKWAVKGGAVRHVAVEGAAQIADDTIVLPKSLVDGLRKKGASWIFGGKSHRRYVEDGGALGQLLNDVKEFPKKKPEWGAGQIFMPSLGSTYADTIEWAANYLGVLHSLPAVLEELIEVPRRGGEIGRLVKHGFRWGAASTTGRAADFVELRQAMKNWRLDGIPLGEGDYLEGVIERLRAKQPQGPLLIHKSVAQAFEKALKITEDPKAQLEVTRVLDSFLDYAKAWFTQPFPAFHVRNLVGSSLLSYMGPEAPFSLSQLLKRTNQVMRAMAKGEALPFETEMQFHRVLQGGVLFGPFTPLSKVKGTGVARGLVEPWLAAGRAVRAPRSLADTYEVLREAQKKLIGAGRAEYTRIESIVRATAYSLLREKGWSPGRAAEWVRKVHYDYGRLAPAERRFMSRIILFYGWLRNNLGAMFPRMFLNFKSMPAKMAWGFSVLQRAAGPLPRWMYETLAVPLPLPESETEEGKLTTVIRQWGIPIEDVGLIHAPWQPGGIQRTIEKLFSRAHPVFSAAYRLASGREPWTGLRLEAGTGLTNVPALDTVISATPWARLVATIVGAVKGGMGVYEAGKGIAEGKSIAEQAAAMGPLLNLATGLKVARYDLELTRLRDMLAGLEEILGTHFPYISEGRYYYIPRKYNPLQPSARSLDIAVYEQLREAIGKHEALRDIIGEELTERGYARPKKKELLGPWRQPFELQVNF